MSMLKRLYLWLHKQFVAAVKWVSGDKYYVVMVHFPYYGTELVATGNVHLFNGCPRTGVMVFREDAEDYMEWCIEQSGSAPQYYSIVQLDAECERVREFLYYDMEN